MYTSTIIATISSAAAIAAPANNVAVNTRSPAVAQAQAAQAKLDVLVANGCDVLGCLAAVAPTSASCAAALAKRGANPVADLLCFGGLYTTIKNPPAVCNGC